MKKDKAPKLNNQWALAFKSAFPITLPVLAGYLVLGFGFGLLLQSKGYNFLWAILMSVTIYGGSMQYVGVDILANAPSILNAAIISAMIQARHIFYGLTLLTKYKGTGKYKPYLIFSFTDETYSLVCANNPPANVDRSKFYFLISILDHSYWIIGGAIGAIFGQLIPINTKGVDFSMTSLFIVILVDNLKNKETRLPAIIGLAVSFACLMIFGAENFLIPALLIISLALFIFKPLLEKNKEGLNND